MPDPYRLGTDRPAAPLVPGSRLRALLWALLALSVAGNSLASFDVLPVQLTIAFGVVTAACVTALVVAHVRGR